MLKFKFLPILAGVAALGAFAVGGPAALADAIVASGNLTVANPDLATQGPGPYASYTITGIGTGPTFTEFEVTASGLNGFVFGDGGVFALNLNTTDTGAGALCANNTQAGCTTGGPSPSDLTLTSAGNEDGFGSFDFKLNDGSGFSSPVSSLTFDFTTAMAVSGANLLLATSEGASVAGHMALSTNTPCSGFAANGGTSSDTPSGNPACTAVPAPVIGHGLLVLLAIGGVLSGGKLLENLKKRHFHAA